MNIPDIKKGMKCKGWNSCKNDAELMGWHYRYKSIKDIGRGTNRNRVFVPMCRYHFIQGFFGIWTLDCTKECKKRAQQRNRTHLNEEDFKTYIPAGLFFGDGAWCPRHQITIPVHCIHCGRKIIVAKTYVRKKELCSCGRASESINSKVFWEDLIDEERSSLCMSHGWRW